MKLYYYPLSAYTRKVLFALYELGIEFERDVIPPNDPAARERVQQVNPLGHAPALVLDDGNVVVESSIIVEHLDLHFGNRRLIPEDRFLALRARALDKFGESIIEPASYIGFASRKPDGTRNDAKIASMTKKLRIALDMLDRELGKGPFLLGEQITIADFAPAAGVAAILFHGYLSLDEWPNVERWWSRAIEPRRSWQRIAEESATAPLPF